MPYALQSSLRGGRTRRHRRQDGVGGERRSRAISGGSWARCASRCRNRGGGRDCSHPCTGLSTEVREGSHPGDARSYQAKFKPEMQGAIKPKPHLAPAPGCSMRPRLPPLPSLLATCHGIVAGLLKILNSGRSSIMGTRRCKMSEKRKAEGASTYNVNLYVYN
jgi:hypothetical protein